MIIDLTVFLLKTVNKCVKVPTKLMCLSVAKLVIISDDYHNIARLLLLMIIVCSKNCTISIID